MTIRREREAFEAAGLAWVDPAEMKWGDSLPDEDASYEAAILEEAGGRAIGLESR